MDDDVRAWAVIQRLAAAVNAHDLDALVDCFAPDYDNRTPVHPARAFTGREQVRRNWTAILGAVADLRMEIVDHAVAGGTVWTEQEHTGTRPDGSPHELRGVVIFGVAADRISTARFYLEPVDRDGSGVDEAVARQVASPPAGPR